MFKQLNKIRNSIKWESINQLVDRQRISALFSQEKHVKYWLVPAYQMNIFVTFLYLKAEIFRCGLLIRKDNFKEQLINQFMAD